jgi:uncharacterized protein (DUF3820 family)
MSTSEELLKWLSGKPVEGMPDNTREEDDGEVNVTSEEVAARVGVNLDKMRAANAKYDPRYSVSVDGTDAKLNFGKHNGRLVSDLANKEVGYLNWMMGQEFPEPLMDVVRYQLGVLPTFAMKELHGGNLDRVFENERVHSGETSLFRDMEITVWPKHIKEANPKCPTCSGGMDVVCALCSTPTAPVEKYLFMCTRCATIFNFKDGKAYKTDG